MLVAVVFDFVVVQWFRSQYAHRLEISGPYASSTWSLSAGSRNKDLFSPDTPITPLTPNSAFCMVDVEQQSQVQQLV